MSSPAPLRAIVSSPRARGLNDHIAVRVVRISELLTRIASASVERRWGLRNTDLRLLNVLDGAGPLSVNEVSRRAHVDKAWVSRSLRDLQRRKLVRRASDPQDTRLSLVQLSRGGQALLDEVRPYALRSELQLLRGVAGRDLKYMLDRLEDNAAQQLAALDNRNGGDPGDPGRGRSKRGRRPT